MTNRTDQPGPELAVVYRRAAQILQGRGHAKGWFCLPTGEVCAAGALLAATGTDPAVVPDGGIIDDSPLMTFLSSRLWVAIDDPDPVERIAEWNDQPERTLAEVVAEFLACAKAIEERHANAVVPVCLRSSDGAVWELASVPAHGDPQYVLAGCELAPPSVFAEYGELTSVFGAVAVGGAA